MWAQAEKEVALRGKEWRLRFDLVKLEMAIRLPGVDVE